MCQAKSLLLAMASSDLDVLLDMGFERPRAELAVKKTGGRTRPLLSVNYAY